MNRSNLCPFAFLLVSIWSALSFAESQCVIGGSPKKVHECFTSECSSQDRSLWVRFPDGRRVYVLGHVHGDRDAVFENFKALALDEKSENWTAALSDFQEEFKVEIAQGREDLEFTKSLISSGIDFKFMAVEAGTDRYQLIRDSYRPAFDEMRKRASDANYDAAKAENVLLVSGSLPTYLDLTRPSWMHFTVVPVEERSLIQAELDAENIAAESLKALKVLFVDRPEALEAIRDDRVAIYSLRSEGVRLGSEQFQGLAEGIKSSPLLTPHGQKVIDYYRNLLAASAASMDRDVRVAKNLTALKGSVISVIGQNHLVSVGKELQKLCLDEKK